MRILKELIAGGDGVISFHTYLSPILIYWFSELAKFVHYNGVSKTVFDLFINSTLLI